MLPIWIINLTENDTDKKSFNHLLSSLSIRQQSYWYYSEIKSGAMDDIASCRLLLNELIEHGRNCYNHFQKEGFAINDLQICITGIIHERLTQTTFHLIPSLLRECMPSIQGEYVHRGIEITGMLFVPHNLNHLSANERSECTLFLEELNTLTEASETDNYNHVVVYQDIQRTDVRYYPELTRKQSVELLFQYLLHLYYVGKDQPKVFDKIQKAGFFSLGAASVYYDSREHKEQSAYRLLGQLIETLKNPGNVSERDTESMIVSKFPRETIAAENILDCLQESCAGLNVDLQQLEGSPDPGPIKHFYIPKLYTSYYLDYLRYMPARAMEFTRIYSHLLTGKVFNQVRKNRENLTKKFRDILSQYDQIFTENIYKYPTLTQLKAALTELKTRFEKEKKKVEDLSAQKERQVFEVPDYLSAYFDDCQTGNSGYTEKDLTENLKKALQQEPTILGLFSRCFLLGTVMIFVLIPILREISPFIINLGDVSKYEYLWIGIIFLLPFLWQFGVRLRRHFLFVRKQKHILLAQALVKVRKKASAKVYLETMGFYDEIIEACAGVLSQCDLIEKELVLGDAGIYPLEIPQTLFNQPLIGGSFMGDKMLPDLAAIGDQITVGGRSLKFSEMGNEDFLKLLQDLFKLPDTCPLVVSATSDLILKTQIGNCLDRMKSILYDRMKMNEEHNMAKVINDISREDESMINLRPLFRMADINGVITNSANEKGIIIRSYQKLDTLPKEVAHAESVCNDRSIEPILFVTCWSKPEINQLSSKSLCDSELSVIKTPIPITTLLTCLFAQYKNQDGLYRLGKIKVPVTTSQLQELETEINRMKP